MDPQQVALMLRKQALVNLSRPPFNADLPVITGTATNGQVLTASQGGWLGGTPMSFTYQWRRNGVNISGANGTTYALVLADVGNTITVRVTATNAAGTTFATSNPTVTVA